MSFTHIFFDKERVLKNLGGTKQASYITRYLDNLGAKTCILEHPYIDRDYMIDYQRFYSRSFKSLEKVTKRFHFFLNRFSADELTCALIENDTNFFNILDKSYLGFVVVKPIKDEDDRELIGRTLLKTYPSSESGIQRHYLKNKYRASLFGINLNIESIPFQSQDQGVSACATVSLWTALQSIINLFGIQRLSPAEITEVSTLFPSPFRRFPQTGLTTEQIINCIRSFTDLDVEIINMNVSASTRENDHAIKTAVSGFLNIGIPLIILLELSNPDQKSDYHAVVVTGYQTDGTEIKELYVHDDQVGPYCRVKSNPTFMKWDYEWSSLYEDIKPTLILAPVYHKIRESFNKIYEERFKINIEAIDEFITSNEKYQKGDIEASLFLTTIQSYKSSLLINTTIEKTIKLELLLMSMPRFIWVIKTSLKNKPIYDEIYDATSVHITLLKELDY